jgi:hypothetical protein
MLEREGIRRIALGYRLTGLSGSSRQQPGGVRDAVRPQSLIAARAGAGSAVVVAYLGLPWRALRCNANERMRPPLPIIVFERR